MSPEQAQPVVRKKSRQQTMSKSEMPASKVSARRLLVDNNNSADEALPQNTTSSAQKNESHPLQNTSTNQSSAMDLPSLPLAVFVFLALLAGVFCLHEVCFSTTSGQTSRAYSDVSFNIVLLLTEIHRFRSVCINLRKPQPITSW